MWENVLFYVVVGALGIVFIIILAAVGGLR